jgi:hypothetical protein
MDTHCYAAAAAGTCGQNFRITAAGTFFIDDVKLISTTRLA